MDFKNWFNVNELRYKGLWRQFKQDNPNIPVAAAKDIYNNRPAHVMRRMLAAHQHAVAPTTAYMSASTDNPTTGFQPMSNITVKDSSNLPTQILSHHSYKDYQWTPKPIVVQVTPNDFSSSTLGIFLARRFGFLTDNHVRDDANRMKMQGQLMNTRGAGENEPVIMIKRDDNKYDLIEGWHRTMNYLVYDGDDKYGAPNDQIALLKNASMPVNDIDLNKWRPVPIKAWLGTKGNKR